MIPPILLALLPLLESSQTPLPPHRIKRLYRSSDIKFPFLQTKKTATRLRWDSSCFCYSPAPFDKLRKRCPESTEGLAP